MTISSPFNTVWLQNSINTPAAETDLSISKKQGKSCRSQSDNFFLYYSLTFSYTCNRLFLETNLVYLKMRIYKKGLDDPGFECRQGQNKFLFSKSTKTALGPTPSSIQWVLGTLFRRQSGWRVNLSTHLHLVPTFRISGAVPLYSLYPFLTRTTKVLLL